MLFTVQEHDLIRQQVEHVESEIAVIVDQETFYRRALLDDKIDEDAKLRLSLHLETLSFIHKGAKNAKAALLALLVPVNKLPDEILSHIFHIGYTQRRFWHGHSFEDSDALEIPSTSIQVCRRWRQVAIATASIWTHISFRKPSEFHLAQLWIERSKVCPLDVKIDAHSFRGKKLSTFQKLIDILLAQVHRLQSLRLQAPNYACIHMFISRFPASAPEMRTLDLVYTGSPPTEYLSLSPFLAEGAPNLISATFSGVHIAWNTPSLANLRILKLGSHYQEVRPSWEVLADFLRSLPQLRILQILDSGPRYGPDHLPSAWPQTPVILPVTAFHFSCSDQDAASEMLRRLVFPKLEAVHMCVQGASPIVVNTLCESKTFANAKKLNMEGKFCATVTDEMITDSFGFPNVDHLTIDDSSPLLTALCRPCFPKLATLCLTDTTAAPLRSIVQTRMETHGLPPPSFLGLYRGRESSQEDISWLKKNVKKLDFHIWENGTDDGDDECVAEDDQLGGANDESMNQSEEGGPDDGSDEAAIAIDNGQSNEGGTDDELNESDEDMQWA